MPHDPPRPREEGNGAMGKIWITALLGLLGAVMAATAGQAGEQALEGRLVNLPLAFDCPAPEELSRHKICNYQIQGVAIATDGEIAQRSIKGTLAFIKGVGPVQSYAIWTYGDGSTLVLEAHGASKMNELGQVKIEGVQSLHRRLRPFRRRPVHHELVGRPRARRVFPR